MPKINWTGFRVSLFVLLALFVFMLACPKVVSGQQVISAKAGLLHYFEGDVYDSEEYFVDHVAYVKKTKIPQSRTEFVQLKTDQLFSTENGRAEILLAPGMFLRMGENCTIKFASVRLEDSHVLIPHNEERCVMVFDFLDMPKDTAFYFEYDDWLFSIYKKGVYHFSTNSPNTNAVLRVLSGEVDTDQMEAFLGRLTKGESLVLREPEVELRKLEKNFSDEMTRWSKRRDGYLAAANVWAAKNVFERLTEYSYRQSNFWYWNPYFGMYTFVPGRNNLDCYWGFRFFNPRGAVSYYNWTIGSGYSNSTSNQLRNTQPAASYGYRPDLGYTVGPRGSWSENSSSPSNSTSPQQSPRTSESATPREGSKGGRER
jgi:hypothetical protein